MANINDQIINGGDLMLFIDGKSIAFATNHTLSISAETAETSSKDTGGMWVAKAIRKISWTMSTENLYAETGEVLLTMNCSRQWLVRRLSKL